MGGTKRKQRLAKSLGNLGDESQGDGRREGDSGGRQGERSAGQRATTGSPPPGLGRGLGTEAKECNSEEWGKRVGGTKGSKNEPKEA